MDKANPALRSVQDSEAVYGVVWLWTGAEGVTVLSAPAIMMLDEAIAQAIIASPYRDLPDIVCPFDKVDYCFRDAVDAGQLRADMCSAGLIDRKDRLTDKARAIVTAYRELPSPADVDDLARRIAEEEIGGPPLRCTGHKAARYNAAYNAVVKAMAQAGEAAHG